MYLKERSAIVTGGGSGIGKRIALKFAEKGADIVVADVNLDSALQTVAQIEQMSRRAVALRTDVSNKNQVLAMKEKALNEYGKIDILVNNAGAMSPPVPIEELAEEDWDHVIAVNLKGVFLCSQAIGREMISRRKGCILNIASVSGHGPYPTGGAYSSSKGAVVMLTQQLALEWAQYNIRVNSISPGMIRTPLNEKSLNDKDVYEGRINLVPLHRIGDPEDIANAAAFLVSDDASFITGTDLFVDGGFMTGLQKLIPGKAGAK